MYKERWKFLPLRSIKIEPDGNSRTENKITEIWG